MNEFVFYEDGGVLLPTGRRLTQAQFEEMRAATPNYFKRVLIGADQLLNAVLGGWPDETLSARAYRQHFDKRRWNAMYRAINILFFTQKDHCRSAFEVESIRRHSPLELRK